MKKFSICLVFLTYCGLLLFGASACSDAPVQTGTASVAGDQPSCPSLESMQAASASDYAQNLQSRLGQYVAQQGEAVNSGQEGRVIVCALIDRRGSRGHVRAAHVARSAGFPLLDGAVLYALSSMDHNDQIEDLPIGIAPHDPEAWLAFQVDFRSPSQPGRVAQGPHPCAERAAACPVSSPTDFSFCPVFSPEAEEKELQHRMLAAVVRELRYPPGAQKFDIEGKALVCVATGPKGEIQDASIVVSSGAPWLDGEALMMMGRIQQKSGLITGYGPMQLPDGGAMMFMPINWTIGR